MSIPLGSMLSDNALWTANRRRQKGWILPAAIASGRGSGKPVAWMPLHVTEEIARQLILTRDIVAFKGEWLMRCRLELAVDER